MGTEDGSWGTELTATKGLIYRASWIKKTFSEESVVAYTRTIRLPAFPARRARSRFIGLPQGSRHNRMNATKMEVKMSLSTSVATSATTPVAAPSPNKFAPSAWSYGPQKIAAAPQSRMEIFTELAKRSEDLETLSGRLGLHPRSARDFFDALVALGFLERQGDVFSNTPSTDISRQEETQLYRRNA